MDLVKFPHTGLFILILPLSLPNSAQKFQKEEHREENSMRLDMETMEGQNKRFGAAAAPPGELHGFPRRGTDWYEFKNSAPDGWADSYVVMVLVQLSTGVTGYHSVASGSLTYADL